MHMLLRKNELLKHPQLLADILITNTAKSL